MKRRSQYGFTLTEVLLAAAIIGLLAALIVPSYSLALRRRENAVCARQLRAAVEAFELYAEETGRWPADTTPGVIPPEMAGYYFPYFKINEWWSDETELGGNFDWDNGFNFSLSVSISLPTVPEEQMAELDRLIDDGNLNAGHFRKAGSQYHYIIEE